MSIFIVVVVLVGCAEKRQNSVARANSVPDEKKPLVFKDFVRNPELFKQLERRDASREVPKDLTDDEIWSLVEQLIAEDSDAEADLLKQIGDRAVPQLVSALGDKRFHVIQKSSRGMLPGHFIERSPIQRVLELLWEHRPPSAVEHLSPLIHHEHSIIRYQAANALGNIGTNDCIQPLKEVLAGDDENMCWGALNGINLCLQFEQASRKFRNEMFTTVEAVLRSPKKWSLHVIDDVPDILLRIDLSRATEILLSDQIINRDHHGLNDVLAALNERQIEIPTESIFRLVSELHDVAKQRPYSLSYGKALIALARTKHPRTDALAREALEWKHEHFSDEAAAAICLLHGIEDAAEFVLARLEDVEFRELSLPQQHFITVSWLQWDVNNGGFTQYFFNSSGDSTREALAGLKAIKAPKTAEILQKAMSTFGEKGPSTDRGARQNQLAELFDEQDDELESLSDEFYEDEDLLEVQLLIFAADNPDHFRPKR